MPVSGPVSQRCSDSATKEARGTRRARAWCQGAPVATRVTTRAPLLLPSMAVEGRSSRRRSRVGGTPAEVAG